MRDVEKSAQVEATLMRAAENIGDITEPVMAVFYQRFPRARDMFEYHGGHRSYSLEAEMVEQALYCLMNWFESPAEVEIVLAGSVPHHADTLKVPPDIYQGLLTATAEVIGNTIPAENTGERAAWSALREALAGVIEDSRRYIISSLETQSP